MANWPPKVSVKFVKKIEAASASKLSGKIVKNYRDILEQFSNAEEQKTAKSMKRTASRR